MRLIARVCVLITLTAHLAALQLTGGDAAASPISLLSRGPAQWIHTIGLLSLSLAWVLIGVGNLRDSYHHTLRHSPGHSPGHSLGQTGILLWRCACVLLFASAAVLLYVAYYFATASEATLFGPNANDPLGVLASLLGVAMGCLQPKLSRDAPRLARANLLVLVAWIALVPVIPFLEPQWLGTYERGVGLLMLAWTALLTILPRNPKVKTS